MPYKSYIHVLKIDKPEVQGILETGECILECKLDGTAGSIWSDINGNIHCGSRTREVSLEKDNGGFMNYMTASDDTEIVALRDYCIANPNLIIFGEFLGVPGGKFLGTIKDYLEGGFFVYSVYDTRDNKYLTYDEYYNVIHSFYHRVIPALARLKSPTLEEVLSYLDKTDYNLPPGTPGEGIVIHKQPIFYDVYSHPKAAKIVRAEYFEKKRSNHLQKKTLADTSNLNSAIIAEYILDSKMNKTKNKIEIMFDGWEDDNKHIGAFLNMVWTDFINEDFDTKLLKKFKNPTINFGQLKADVFAASRKFLGLI